MYEYDLGFRPVRPRIWTPSQVELNRKLRTLWEQHIYWTRLTVNSIIGRLPDEKATTGRLLRNPADFADALRPLYGPAIASRFASLLREHLTIAAELVHALQAGNAMGASQARNRWFQNADAIAAFLAGINPHWSREAWRRMMHEHLELLSQEVASRLAGHYEENVATNDRVEPQALEMADVMTEGIIRQFPGAFTY
ncbi:acetylglutamate kinase [Gorillibacterium sp. sgz5001074]|uniref:acetylglutamate kinase n=1 Tax=Gorillibacterium sp. sgz5001074 TaxID=3446695 RepID=UPI003F680584